MDINDLRGIGTVLCLIAFLAIVCWAYSPSRKDAFEKAAQLPFSDTQSDEASEHE
ncbi:MAG: cbb3-type cytochrome c oxidase subunit 3 [Pseudomonadales bacterium]